MNTAKLAENLQKLGYTVSRFATKEEAAAYLDRTIDGKTVGFGGSVTLEEMGLYQLLQSHNDVRWHWRISEGGSAEERRRAGCAAEIYLTSVNGIAESGEIINIDATGNRVAATLYGPRKVYFVVGSNKIADDFDSALSRARQIASPMNARRLDCATPCAKAGTECFNCRAPRRICRALTVLWAAPFGADYEVVLIDQPLGY